MASSKRRKVFSRVAAAKSFGIWSLDLSAASPDKHRLVVQERTGYYLALLATIRFRPEDTDWELILKMKPHKLPPGFTYFKLIEAVEALKADGKATASQFQQLHDWLKALPKSTNYIGDRINAIIK
jgi:hypothetical protein